MEWICLLFLALFSKPLLKTSQQFDPVKEEFPINYPMEPMFENYASIKDEILACSTEKELKTAYVRILVFEGCYNDSATFTHDLIELYLYQEQIVKDYTY